jgi:hypothetical protein
MKPFFLALALAGCSVFGIRSGTPEPAYQVIAKAGPVEIRHYAPRLAASVTIPGDELQARYQGFKRLASYIFGANTGKTSISMTAPVAQSATKIAMTAPVAQTRNSTGSWTITFYMPANYTMATLPKPADPGIFIHTLPASLDAVIRFSGIPGTTPVAREQTALLQALSRSGWAAAGEPVAWFYDPPWTLPWCRRNEVAVPVAPR